MVRLWLQCLYDILWLAFSPQPAKTNENPHQHDGEDASGADNLR